MTTTPKYYVRNLKGETISEPTVVLRAQDRFSTYALAGYVRFLETQSKYQDSTYLQELKDILYDIMYWQATNPGKVKDPD